MPSISFRLPAAAACLLLLAGTVVGFVPADGKAADAAGYQPPIQPPSDEAERALSLFRVPEGMTASLVAAEPDLANPVAFWIDERGRYWVCETFRQGNAVVDNRGREYWLLDDLAAQTVEDRLAYYEKHLGAEGLKAFSEHHDRIRLLTDTDGDGKVNEATVFADGFNAPEEGTGSGVLTVGDDVYYTNIPNLWRLRDKNGDGVADEREKLASGFGVRTAFRGHDMHGLVMGPDGRIYFSIGDRGYNVVTQEGETLARPDCGAVFRCEPDGSNLEVFAYGLRNPQELAFDDYGNLFTGDNNSDSGDKARWVYVAEGSDSGWRMYYQYLDDRGPWNREMMWYPHDSPPLRREGPGGVPKGALAKEMQPAYILPPVTNLGDGPSGLTYYPGVGLSERYDGHFFLCDFRGTPTTSGVRSFAVKPKGAGFELVDSHEFIWSILCTDADFAPDGRLVISDWVNGWNGEGKGRLYAFTDPKHVKEGEESAKLLGEDFAGRTAEELIGLFSHRDRRVRQRAHLAWSDRLIDGDAKLLSREAFIGRGPLEQLHYAWAVGIAARRQPGTLADSLGEIVDWLEPVPKAAVTPFYGDALAAIRSEMRDLFQSEGVLNELRDRFATDIRIPFLKRGVRRLADLLDHDDARVRAAAAVALSKAEHHSDGLAVRLLNVLQEDAGHDPVLRNAAITGLTRLAEGISGTWVRTALGGHESRWARLGIVVAFRRLNDPEVAKFLTDTDPAVVTEAARAINDVPIEAATPQLASLAGRDRLNDPTLRRILNANFRLGEKQNAEAVAKVAADAGTPARLRIEALAELNLWSNPPPLDRVTGMYRPVEARDAAFVAEVVRPLLGGLLADEGADVRTAAIGLAATYEIGEAAAKLREIADDGERGDEERVAALDALAAVGADDLDAILAKAVDDESAAVRSQARSIWAEHDAEAAVPVLDRTIAEGEMVEKQAAIATLARIGAEVADAVLARWFDKFISGQVPAEIGLELIEAAGQRESLAGRLAAYESAISSGDKLAAWRVALVGGDADTGRDIFLNRSSVSCLRCHKVDDDRGGEVGPNLAKIALTKDRSYLLESIVASNAKIAEGFESVVVVTTEGRVYTGVKRAEDEKSLTLITAEGTGIVIPKDQIEERAVGQSAMPEDLVKHLSQRDVRDLVEYLSRQQGQGAWEEGETEE